MISPLDPKQASDLLNALRVQLGFCISPEAASRLVAEPPEDPREFADEVIAAQEWNPANLDLHLCRQVRDMVAAAYRAAEGARD